VIVTVTLNTAVDRTIEVPGLAVGKLLKGRLLFEQPAGKGVNISRCLSALGVRSTATGFVGELEKRRFTESLDGGAARARFISVAGRTRQDTTLLDPKRNGSETHIREAGFRVSRDDVDRLQRLLEEICSSRSVVAVCGSLPQGLALAHLRRLLQACRRRGARLVIDMSGKALETAARLGGFLMKPNLAELGELLGRKVTDLEKAAICARPLLRRFERVLISGGAEGAVLLGPGGAWKARCRLAARDVLNTVGCGDALLAGYLAAAESALGEDECLRRAVACGSAAATTRAAGMLDPRRVRELIEKTALSRLG